MHRRGPLGGLGPWVPISSWRPRVLFAKCSSPAPSRLAPPLFRFPPTTPIACRKPASTADAPFLMALVGGGNLEWVRCTQNDKAAMPQAHLTVQRGQEGTAARAWAVGATKIIATASGHKSLDARADRRALAHGPRLDLHKRIFERLRLPKTLYQRKFGGASNDFPREVGREFPGQRLSSQHRMSIPAAASFGIEIPQSKARPARVAASAAAGKMSWMTSIGSSPTATCRY